MSGSGGRSDELHLPLRFIFLSGVEVLRICHPLLPVKGGFHQRVWRRWDFMRFVFLFFVLTVTVVRSSGSVQIDQTEERASELISRWTEAQEIANNCPAVKSTLDSSILVDTRERYVSDGKKSIQIASQMYDGQERPASSFFYNKDYASKLSRDKSGEAWLLDELVVAEDAGFATFKRTRVESCDLFRSVACFMELRDLLIGDDFRIAEVSDCTIGGKVFCRVHIKINDPSAGRHPVYSATLLFRKAEGSDEFETWPARVCIEGPKNGKFATYVCELENKFPVAVRILQGKHLDSVPDPAKSDVNYVFEKIPFRDDLFKLSHFGYPEPKGARRKFPILWIAVFACGVIGLAIVARRTFWR